MLNFRTKYGFGFSQHKEKQKFMVDPASHLVLLVPEVTESELASTSRFACSFD